MQCKHSNSAISVAPIPLILRLCNKRFCADTRDDATYVQVLPRYYFFFERSVKLNLEEEQKRINVQIFEGCRINIAD